MARLCPTVKRRRALGGTKARVPGRGSRRDSRVATGLHARGILGYWRAGRSRVSSRTHGQQTSRRRVGLESEQGEESSTLLVREGWNHVRSQRPLAAWASWQRALPCRSRFIGGRAGAVNARIGQGITAFGPDGLSLPGAERPGAARGMGRTAASRRAGAARGDGRRVCRPGGRGAW